MSPEAVLRLLSDDPRVIGLEVELDGEAVRRVSIRRAPPPGAVADTEHEAPERPETIWDDPDMWSASGVRPA